MALCAIIKPHVWGPLRPPGPQEKIFMEHGYIIQRRAEGQRFTIYDSRITIFFLRDLREKKGNYQLSINN